METKGGVFIVSKAKGSIKKVEAPKAVQRNKSERSFLFYGKENGQSVQIPGPKRANIKIKDLFRGRKYDEPLTWKNDYEVVLTEIGYVLIGADVRRGIAEGLHDYPVYWYDSLASAREDYQIGTISMLPEKEDTDGRSTDKGKGCRNSKSINCIVEALFDQERDALAEKDEYRPDAVRRTGSKAPSRVIRRRKNGPLTEGTGDI